MSIRTKLLVLLLGVVLGAMGLNALFTLVETKRLAEGVSATTRDNLQLRGERELEGLVNSYRRIISGNKWGAELTIIAIADGARVLIEGDALAEAPVPSDDSGETGRNPDALIDRYGDLFPGTSVSEEVVFHVAPESDLETAARQARALASIGRTFRSLDASDPAFVGSFGLRYVAFESGLLAVYPGLDVFPEAFDARKTPWYRAAMRFADVPDRLADAEGPVLWNRLAIDPVSNRVVMTGAIPLRDANGRPIGVVAVDIPIESVLIDLTAPAAIERRTATKLVVPIPPGTTDQERAELEDKIRLRTGGVTETDRRLIAEGGLMVIAERLPTDDPSVAGAPNPQGAALPTVAPSTPELLDIDRIFADGPGAQGVKNLVAAMLTNDVGARPFVNRDLDRVWAWGRIDGDTFLTIDVPRDILDREADALRKDINIITRERLRTTAMIALGVSVVAIALGLLASRRLIRPLLELRGVAERIAAGDFEARAEVRTGDEIERLGQTFNDMVPQLADRMRLRESISVAQQVQQHLLPSCPPELPGLEVIAKSIYCDETGGDYFDFVPLNGHRRARTVVAVGDVTGHGIAAALVMASARAILRSRAVIDEELSEVAAAMNEQLFLDSLDGRFMTLFVLEIDRESGDLTWVSAGHEPGMLYDPASDQFEDLKGQDIPLGIENQWTFRSNSRSSLVEGQVLLLGTDGIWETRDASGELFGKDRLREIVRDNAAAPMEMLQAEIEKALQSHRAGRPQEDDVTLVVLRAVRNAPTRADIG
ncbi:MAG: SpoIIE family protein phosphatase [Planctomycetota bacterium]